MLYNVARYKTWFLYGDSGVALFFCNDVNMLHFLQNLSTSPEQEPDDFLSHTRESLQWMIDHPRPYESIFRDNKTLTFTLQDGYWKQDPS